MTLFISALSSAGNLGGAGLSSARRAKLPMCRARHESARWHQMRNRHKFAAPTSGPRSSLPDLPRCAFSPSGKLPGFDCAVQRPDIPLRNAFFSDLRRLSSSERERAVSLDVGANSGDFSNYIARIGNQVAPGRRLHLVMFDPQPRMARRLTKLVRQLSNLGAVNATFLPVAAWTRDGNASFFSAGRGRSVESSLSMSQAGQDSATQVVRTIDLAAYLHADFFAGAAVRLLKIVSTAIAHRISRGLTSNSQIAGYRRTAAPAAPPHRRTVAVAPLHRRTSFLSLNLLVRPRVQDVEVAEYDLLPHLLLSGALCIPTHLLVEWHLNALPPPRRLAGLALRLGFDELLKTGCATSDHGSGPRVTVHDDFDVNNEFADVPGLAELHRRHNGTWPVGCAKRPNCRVRWRNLIEHAGATAAEAAAI